MRIFFLQKGLIVFLSFRDKAVLLAQLENKAKITGTNCLEFFHIKNTLYMFYLKYE